MTQIILRTGMTSQLPSRFRQYVQICAMQDVNYKKIMVINAGSSSVRIALFSCVSNVLQELADYRAETKITSPEEVVRSFIAEQKITTDIVIAHRVVHGGISFKQPVVIDDNVKDEISRLSVLAPLHNPPALKLIEVCEAVFAHQIMQIAVFDTAFFHDLPLVARTYALPIDICKKHHIHRYGFHGLAHEYMWQQWCQLTNNKKQYGKVITIQLGSGCSITATQDGQPLDTSMGFSPLEGLVMATRSGDLDPGILVYLQTVAGYHVSDLDELLNKQSGLLGLSGRSGDVRDLLTSTDTHARLAIEIFIYRLRKYIGSYLAVLNGADAIIFGGGIGEHNPEIRTAALNTLTWFGISLDDSKNQRAFGSDTLISLNDSNIDVWIIKVKEAKLIAEQAWNVIAG